MIPWPRFLAALVIVGATTTIVVCEVLDTGFAMIDAEMEPGQADCSWHPQARIDYLLPFRPLACRVGKWLGEKP